MSKNKFNLGLEYENKLFGRNLLIIYTAYDLKNIKGK